MRAAAAAFAASASGPKNGFDIGHLYAQQDVEVWPENWPAWSLFSEMSGQWRMSPMRGPIALDYTPLFARMARLGLTDEQWEQRFADVRVIEAAALEQIRQDH